MDVLLVRGIDERITVIMITVIMVTLSSGVRCPSPFLPSVSSNESPSHDATTRLSTELSLAAWRKTAWPARRSRAARGSA